MNAPSDLKPIVHGPRSRFAMAALADLKLVVQAPGAFYRRIASAIGARMPKGLYARALIIIIAPMVLLQSVVAFVFLERHWATVTGRLSTATVQSIAMLIETYQAFPQNKKNAVTLTRLANNNLGLRVKIVSGD